MTEQVTGAGNEARGTADATHAVALERRFKGGARWFYWIAGLSLVNSVVALTHGNMSFIVGLAVTQFIDGIVTAFTEKPGVSMVSLTVALFADVLVAGIFVLFGYFASRKRRWAFVVGMVLYALDGLVFLVFKQWIAVAFHAFVLASLFAGLQACTRLLETPSAPGTGPPPPIG